MDWLFGTRPPSIVTEERLWLNDSAFRNALDLELAEMADDLSIVMAHFPRDLLEIQERLNSRRIPCRFWQVPRNPTECLRELSRVRGEILLMDVRTLPDWRETSAHDLDVRPKISIVQCHHHPLPNEDARVLAFAAVLGPTASVTIFTSLDHPLLRRFAGSEIQNTLKILGMREDEPITNRMVLRQIRRAQQKIASQVPTPLDADTCEAWFERNLGE